MEQETLSLKVKASLGFFLSEIIQKTLLHPRCNALDSKKHHNAGSCSLHDTHGTEE